jgi:hypothetical protein
MFSESKGTNAMQTKANVSRYRELVADSLLFWYGVRHETLKHWQWRFIDACCRANRPVAYAVNRLAESR